MRRRRWPLVILVLYAAMTIAILVAPVSPESIVRRTVDFFDDVLGWSFIRTGHVDAAYNVLLFIPLGFLMTLLFRRRWVGVLIALVLSLSVELVQTLLPQRTASLRDVLTNSVGAAIGAIVALVITRHRMSHAASDVAGRDAEQA